MEIRYGKITSTTSRATLTNDSGTIIVEPSNVHGFDLFLFADGGRHLTFEDALQLAEELTRAANGALNTVPVENIVRIDGQAYRMVLEPVSEDALSVPRATR